jgi:hypothetical protein
MMSALTSIYYERNLWHFLFLTALYFTVAGRAQSAGWITTGFCFDSRQGQELFFPFRSANTGSAARHLVPGLVTLV